MGAVGTLLDALWGLEAFSGSLGIVRGPLAPLRESADSALGAFVTAGLLQSEFRVDFGGSRVNFRVNFAMNFAVNSAMNFG